MTCSQPNGGAVPPPARRGHVADYIAMRNSADPDTPPLIFTPAEWTAFTVGVRDGEFDFTSGAGE